MDQEIEQMIRAAKLGGKIAKKYFGAKLEVAEKSMAADLRTKADTESETAIIDSISKSFPSYNILSEERGFIDHKSAHTFVIDPLDGSNNFILGIPNFMVSIALLQGNDVVAGVIYHPILDCTYYAATNQGAFLDDMKIQVNTETNIEKTTVAYHCGYVNSLDYQYKVLKRAHELSKRVLVNWCATLDFCLLATGKIESIISNGLILHDFIAGKIIAREAGAIITDFKGNKEASDKNPFFVASNSLSIHKNILKTL